MSQQFKEFILTYGSNCSFPYLLGDDVQFSISLYMMFILFGVVISRIPVMCSQGWKKQTYHKSILVFLLGVFCVFDLVATLFHVLIVYTTRIEYLSFSVGLLDLKGIFVDGVVGYFYFQLFFLIRDVKEMKYGIQLNLKYMITYLVFSILIFLVATILFIVQLDSNYNQRTKGLLIPTYVSMVSGVYHIICCVLIVVYIYTTIKELDERPMEICSLFDRLLYCTFVYSVYAICRTIQQYAFVYDPDGIHRQTSYDHLRVAQYTLIYVCLIEIVRILYPNGLFLAPMTTKGGTTKATATSNSDREIEMDAKRY
eukprot:TRINITY_DN11592_c0_g1_i1.p1 TRINITY_DN11592_c0_g1~~TRINITY_DN11592_c0_g1_i1.p1  ORF type:complete len:312 (-),score=17.10 TRINITY_DN11592_c0_g1_i1:59-994(-)